MIQNQSTNYGRKQRMPKKKTKGQFSNYKKWVTSEGFTFLAKDKTDALEYLKKMPKHMGDVKTLREVKI